MNTPSKHPAARGGVDCACSYLCPERFSVDPIFNCNLSSCQCFERLYELAGSLSLKERLYFKIMTLKLIIEVTECTECTYYAVNTEKFSELINSKYYS